MAGRDAPAIDRAGMFGFGLRPAALLLLLWLAPGKHLWAANTRPYEREPDRVLQRLARLAPRLARARSFTFAVLGDSKHSPHLGEVLELARKLEPDFAVFVGDFVLYGGWSAREWRAWEREIRPLASRVPVLPVAGNHELARGAENGRRRFREFYALPRLYYCADVANCRLVVLGWGFENDPRQVRWLEQTLAGAGRRHIFVFAHIPFFSAGKKRNNGISNRETRFTRMFSRYRVACVFSGHDHLYSRMVRGGVTYVVSGCAGAKPHPLQNRHLARKGEAYAGRLPGTAADYVNRRPDSPLEHSIKSSLGLVLVTVSKGGAVTLKARGTAGEIWDRATLPLPVPRPVPGKETAAPGHSPAPSADALDNEQNNPPQTTTGQERK